MEIGIATLSSKGQIVIPNNVRESMKLEDHEQFVVISEDNEIIIKPVKEALGIKRKNSKYVKDLIATMRGDRILAEMESGKELSAEEVL